MLKIVKLSLKKDIPHADWLLNFAMIIKIQMQGFISKLNFPYISKKESLADGSLESLQS